MIDAGCGSSPETLSGLLLFSRLEFEFRSCSNPTFLPSRFISDSIARKSREIFGLQTQLCLEISDRCADAFVEIDFRFPVAELGPCAGDIRLADFRVVHR